MNPENIPANGAYRAVESILDGLKVYHDHDALPNLFRYPRGTIPLDAQQQILQGARQLWADDSETAGCDGYDIIEQAAMEYTGRWPEEFFYEEKLLALLRDFHSDGATAFRTYAEESCDEPLRTLVREIWYLMTYLWGPFGVSQMREKAEDEEDSRIHWARDFTAMAHKAFLTKCTREMYNASVRGDAAAEQKWVEEIVRTAKYLWGPDGIVPDENTPPGTRP